MSRGYLKTVKHSVEASVVRMAGGGGVHLRQEAKDLTQVLQEKAKDGLGQEHSIGMVM